MSNVEIMLYIRPAISVFELALVLSKVEADLSSNCTESLKYLSRIIRYKPCSPSS